MAVITGILGAIIGGATLGNTIYQESNQPSAPTTPTTPTPTPPKPSVTPQQLSTGANTDYTTGGGVSQDYLSSILQGQNPQLPIDYTQLQGFAQPGVSYQTGGS